MASNGKPWAATTASRQPRIIHGEPSSSTNNTTTGYGVHGETLRVVNHPLFLSERRDMVFCGEQILASVSASMSTSSPSFTLSGEGDNKVRENAQYSGTYYLSISLATPYLKITWFVRRDEDGGR